METREISCLKTVPRRELASTADNFESYFVPGIWNRHYFQIVNILFTEFVSDLSLRSSLSKTHSNAWQVEVFRHLFMPTIYKCCHYIHFKAVIIENLSKTILNDWQNTGIILLCHFLNISIVSQTFHYTSQNIDMSYYIRNKKEKMKKYFVNFYLFIF